MKLCVYQGTFNPIHNAHLRVADYVVEKYDFDKLIFIPAYNPPHKNLDIAIASHRLNMVKLATQNNDKFEVSDIEYKLKGKSYTYNTICELYKKYDVEGKINFIIGTDAFKNITKWFNADKLKELVKFIVFSREENLCKSDYDTMFEKGYDFVFETLSFEDISSSSIREKVKKGESIKGLVEEKTEEYIIKNGLYKN